MAGLSDGTGLGLIDLPLVRYVVMPHGTEVEAWPPWLSLLLRDECAISGWEVWCESTDMRRRRRRDIAKRSV